MSLDDFQQAWKNQASRTQIKVDGDWLLKLVQGQRRRLRSTVFWRDFREVLVAALLIPYWFYAGLTYSLPWTWWLSVPALLFVAGFMLVYRWRRPQPADRPDEPLVRCAEHSLREVDDQVWLLKNVFWWYLLPPSVSFTAFIAQVSLSIADTWTEALVKGGPLIAFLFVVDFGLYMLNQWAVRKALEPRRRELLELLAELGDDSIHEQIDSIRINSEKSTRRLRRWSIVVCGTASVLIATALFYESRGSALVVGGPRTEGKNGKLLGRWLEEQRAERKLVGLGAMIMIDGNVEGVAACGERKFRSGVPIETADRWLLPGVTKSMTATMIARLIESGKLKWTDTLGTLLPGVAMHEDWRPVTVRQLLTDSAGAPVFFSDDVMRLRPRHGIESTQARRDALLEVIRDEATYPAGEKHLHSLVGYSLIAAVVEAQTGLGWEELIKREVFEPLGLKASGFGPPVSSDRKIEQPRGHRASLMGKIAADDKLDNTSIAGPAGAIHMSLRDLCTYIDEHLRGERGEGKLLSAESYTKLHTPDLDNYACGWVKRTFPAQIPNTTYWHNGSNTLWYAFVEFIPEYNLVVAVTINEGDSARAEPAALHILRQSIERFGHRSKALIE